VIRELGDVVEESCHHIVFDAKLRHLVVGVFPASVCDNFLQYISYGLLLLVVVDRFR